MTVTPIEGWNPDQYERFFAERRQPFDDLVALCTPVPGGRVVDLGCGTGNLTVELHERMQAAETVGIDSSESMLARARANHGDVPGLTFTEGDIETWLGEGLDLVFANASLQWVDDHLNLLARMRTALADGGQLAFQVPSNFRHPSHLLARQVANEAPFIDALDEDAPEDRGRFVLSPEIYADLALRARRPETDRAHGGLRSRALLDLRRRRVGDGDSAHAVPHTAQSRAVHRFRRAVPRTPLEELGEREPYFYGFRRILCWARFR